MIYYFLAQKKLFIYLGDWGLGIGDWGLGIGDWGLGPIPNPNPNPQSPIPNINSFKPNSKFLHIKKVIN